MGLHNPKNANNNCWTIVWFKIQHEPWVRLCFSNIDYSASSVKDCWPIAQLIMNFRRQIAENVSFNSCLLYPARPTKIVQEWSSKSLAIDLHSKNHVCFWKSLEPSLNLGHILNLRCMNGYLLWNHYVICHRLSVRRDIIRNQRNSSTKTWQKIRSYKIQLIWPFRQRQQVMISWHRHSRLFSLLTTLAVPARQCTAALHAT